jgi:galactose oxidase
VLTWSANDQFTFGGSIPETETATFNPATGTVTAKTVTNTNHDMFCPGISMLASGEIVVTGGNNAEKTSIYSPSQSAWMPGPNMNIPRGYQASTLLSTGEVCLSCAVTLLVCVL